MSDSISSPSAAAISPAHDVWPLGTVLCDLAPLGVLRVDGPDAQTFLQGQLSNDVRRVAGDHWQYTTYNSPKGRVLANFVLWAEDGGYRALLPRELLDELKKRLTMYVLRSKVMLRDDSTAVRSFGLCGPAAADAVRQALGVPPPRGCLSRAGDARVLGIAADRFVVLAPVDQAEAIEATLRRHARPVAFEVWQWLDVRAGVPTITAATQDRFVLQTANLDALHAVSFDKGCYTGQEIIARMQYLGRLKERLSLWHADEREVAPGTRLYSSAFGDQACGTVANAAPAPNGGTDLLAVVQIAAAESGDLHLGAPDGPRLEPLALPYSLPEPPAAPRRLA